LARVAGRAEWGVQVRLDASGGSSVRRAQASAHRETAGLSPGTRFLELRRRQRDATRGAIGGARVAVAALYRSLARHADAARRRPPVSVDGRPALLLDAAFLVPACARTRFRQVVRAQATQAAQHGLASPDRSMAPCSFVAGRL
jgi:hypothetical protein